LDLGLSGALANEWISFCKVLIGLWVHLQHREDLLIWTGGDNFGLLSVNNVYNALQKKKLAVAISWLEEAVMVLGYCFKD